jgi:type I restriction enzyme R subunit
VTDAEYGPPEDGDSEVNEPGSSYDGSGVILDDPVEPKQKTVVRLGDGKEREIKYSVDTKFYMDGRAVSPHEFLEMLFGQIPELFKDEDDLRRQWSDPRTRELLLQGLAERGFEEEKLQALKQICDAEDSDIYDVLRYIAYAKETMTRVERAGIVREYYLEQLDDNEREFVSFILDTYEKRGEKELSMQNLTSLVSLHYRTMRDATTVLGSADQIVHDYLELQSELYVAVGE